MATQTCAKFYNFLECGRKWLDWFCVNIDGRFFRNDIDIGKVFNVYDTELGSVLCNNLYDVDIVSVYTGLYLGHKNKNNNKIIYSLRFLCRNRLLC